MIDTHVHTKEFSKDSSMPFQRLLDVAEKDPSLKFCITEHYDYDYYRPDAALIVDLSEYADRFQASKHHYESIHETPFPVFRGIEFGYLPHLSSFYDCLYDLSDADSIIGSVHCVDGLDPYLEGNYYAKSKQYVYRRYLEQIIEMLHTCRGYDIVGHFDYIARYAPYPDRSIKYEDFKDCFDELLSLCVAKGKALELNTKTSVVFSSDARGTVLFDPDILARYKELGGSFITLGSDAHDETALFQLFGESIDFIKRVGFSSIYYYDDHKPIAVPI